MPLQTAESFTLCPILLLPHALRDGLVAIGRVRLDHDAPPRGARDDVLDGREGGRPARLGRGRVAASHPSTPAVSAVPRVPSSSSARLDGKQSLAL